MTSPFRDFILRAYLSRRSELDGAVRGVLERGVYILGREVELFEEEFARYLKISGSVGVASGTDALRLALQALDIRTGDIVLTVSHTAVATVAAIEMTGASAMLVDVDPLTYTINPNIVEDALKRDVKRQIKAIIPVHLYGQSSDVSVMRTLADKYQVWMIEDCAQAQGAEWNGIKTGSWGDISAFSFYPTKNLAAVGDAGLVASHNSEILSKVRRLREYGWGADRISLLPGINSRLDEVQAAILRVRLKYLDEDNEKRRAIAKTYTRRINRDDIILPFENKSARHVFHQYVVRTSHREIFREFLMSSGVPTSIHYPVPVHLQPGFQGRVVQFGSLAFTERIASEVVSLPLSPFMTEVEVDMVCQAVQQWEPQ